MLIHMAPLRQRPVQMGFSMIEVLVTIVIIAVGLLGLSGLQAKVSIMEMESYQRAQALTLLQDMEDRIRATRLPLCLPSDICPPTVPTCPTGATCLTGPLAPVASGSATTTVGPNGTTGYNPSNSADCSALTTGAQRQVCQWALAVNGAAETVAGSKVGAMLGARGCIISVPPLQPNAQAEFYLVVVWQGFVASADPDAGSHAANCASSVEFGTGLRRAAVTRVLIPKLDS